MAKTICYNKDIQVIPASLGLRRESTQATMRVLFYALIFTYDFISDNIIAFIVSILTSSINCPRSKIYHLQIPVAIWSFNFDSEVFVHGCDTFSKLHIESTAFFTTRRNQNCLITYI